jgi:hypothetical protein
VDSAAIADNTVASADILDNQVSTADINSTIWASSVHQAGTFASRPAAAGNAGYLYYATDTDDLWRSDGSAWTKVGTGGTVTSSEITDLTITGADIANDTITATQINANAITSSELAANAVTLGKINTGAADSAAIADNTVTSTDILDATIATGDLANGAVTAAKLATGGAALPATTIPFRNGDTTDLSWAVPAAQTELAATTKYETKFDLTTVTQARLNVDVITSQTTGTGVLRAEYFNTTSSTWVPLDGTSGPSISILNDSNTLQTSSWVTIQAAALADVKLRVAGINGNAVAATFGNIDLQVRR